MTVLAAEPPADATSVAVSTSDHQDEKPEVFLYTVEGGALEIVVDCSACLLDVEVVRWREANGAQTAPISTANDIVNDVVDGARLELPEHLVGRALALEMHATLLSEDGTSTIDVEQVVFVTMVRDVDGLSTVPISWADYLLANSFARVDVRKNGERVLNLSGVTP